MNIFRKRKDTPDSQEQAPSMTEIHASPPASDAAVVIGGLDWYRTQFRRTMKLALGLGAALCMSIAVTTLLLLNQPKPQYFAATPDLRLAPMVPLDQPLLTQEGLLTWTVNAITGAMSLNFLEWREKLETLRPNFDDAAYKSFLAFSAKFRRSGHDSGQEAFRFRHRHTRPGHHRFRSGGRQGHMENRVPPDCFL